MPPHTMPATRWNRRSVACAMAAGLFAVIAGAPAGAAAAGKTLYSFQGGSDGTDPQGALIEDGSDNLYGTTTEGGGGSCNFSCGTVFKLATGGKENVLHAFAGGTDGAYPNEGLIEIAGNFYGATGAGGGSSSCNEGCGTIFELTPGGTETELYAFQGGSDGIGPLGSLVTDGHGNFYGATVEGGSFTGNECADEGCGTVFELSTSGSKSILYSFHGGSDGANPEAGLIADDAGNLYGTTIEGGNGIACGGSLGCGTVFKVTPGGTETVLYAFQGGSDGAWPHGAIISDAAGNLYGTTTGGGQCSLGSTGCGTVFKLSPTGTETILHAFQGGSDGLTPLAGLAMDKAGNLYGTTPSGGNTRCVNHEGCGTVFELMHGGKEKVLYAFTQSHGQFPHGASPAAGLLIGKHGTLYGTTTAGGDKNVGVVFSIKN
jgi:uncharacterized repeat protein (TIGR03803 family)